MQSLSELCSLSVSLKLGCGWIIPAVSLLINRWSLQLSIDKALRLVREASDHLQSLFLTGKKPSVSQIKGCCVVCQPVHFYLKKKKKKNHDVFLPTALLLLCLKKYVLIVYCWRSSLARDAVWKNVYHHANFIVIAFYSVFAVEGNKVSCHSNQSIDQLNDLIIRGLTKG